MEDAFTTLSEALNALMSAWEQLYDEISGVLKVISAEVDYDRIPPRILPGSSAAPRSAFRAPPSAAYRHWRCSVYGKH